MNKKRLLYGLTAFIVTLLVLGVPALLPPLLSLFPFLQSFFATPDITTLIAVRQSIFLLVILILIFRGFKEDGVWNKFFGVISLFILLSHLVIGGFVFILPFH